MSLEDDVKAELAKNAEVATRYTMERGDDEYGVILWSNRFTLRHRAIIECNDVVVRTVVSTSFVSAFNMVVDIIAAEITQREQNNENKNARY